MTDLHTHILPAMDDGAADVQESLALLRMEREQGVDTVVLTPHFYRDRENPTQFLRRREQAYAKLTAAVEQLPPEERDGLPRLVLGAEVAWWPGLSGWEQLNELRIGDTRNLLVELPFIPWNDRLIRELYDFYGQTGLTPVLAHIDRYLTLQKTRHIRDVLQLGVPVQLGTERLLRLLGRGKALKLLSSGQAHLLASDCHNTGDRAPALAAAMDVVRKKLGDGLAQELIRCADELAGVC